MRLLVARIVFFFKCLKYLGVTPRQLRHVYADLCLAVQPEPFEISSGLFLHGDSCTSVWLYTAGVSVAINAALFTEKLGIQTLKGLSIQQGDEEGCNWKTVFRTQPNIFELGEWIDVVRTAIKARVRPHIAPLPWLWTLGRFDD